jgi:hypothetical protein
MTKYIILIMAGCLTLAAACKKKTENTPEPTIDINLQSPTAGATYAYGDTVWVKAHVSSPVELHGYEWRIKNKTTNMVAATGDDHIHGKEIDISGYWINDVSATAQMDVEVVVEIDHDGDESEKEISITCNQ